VHPPSSATLHHMMRPLSILAPTRYPWRFNAPRTSRHHIENRRFLPLNYLSPRIEGVTLFNPWPPHRFDLIHAFNRIPLGRLPFVIGFESHLPRAFGWEHSAWFRWMTRRLATDGCRAIVAISEFARRIFLARHPDATALRGKLHVRYPNLVIPDLPDMFDPLEHGPVRLVFVGNHFARKGGCVAVTMAELAHQKGIPVELDVVSRLEMGGAIWTDPAEQEHFVRYRARLRLPNVRLHQDLPNASVLDLLRRAHFSILATFGDTFGYSALESMANGTPVIATRQGALPELITHRQNGILLDLPTTQEGEWVHLNTPDRRASAFVRHWHDEVRRLAEAALGALQETMADRTRFAAMRACARQSVQRFSADAAARFWDDFYERAVEGIVPAAES